MSADKKQIRNRKPLSLDLRLEDVLRFHANKISGVHVACEAMPVITSSDFARLRSSIERHGVVHPVLVDADRVLIDGRSRLSAMYLSNTKITEDMIQVYEGDLGAVLASNVYCRDLSTSQRVIVAASWLQFERDGGRNQLRKAVGNRSKHVRRSIATKRREFERGNTVLHSSVEKFAGVKRVWFESAVRLLDNLPELAEAVRLGKITLAKALDDAGLLINSPTFRKKTKEAQQPAPSGQGNVNGESLLETPSANKKVVAEAGIVTKAVVANDPAPGLRESITSKARAFLKRCSGTKRTKNNGPPSLTRMAKLCGTRKLDLQHFAEGERSQLSVEAVAVILHFAEAYPKCKCQTIHLSQHALSRAAGKWLTEDPKTRKPFSVVLEALIST